MSVKIAAFEIHLLPDFLTDRGHARLAELPISLCNQLTGYGVAVYTATHRAARGVWE